MKNKLFVRFFSIIVACTISLSFTTTIFAESYNEISTYEDFDIETTEYSVKNVSDPPLESIEKGNDCKYSVLCTFNNTTMTIDDIYEKTSISLLLEDIAYYAEDQSAVVLKNGEEVYDGYLEENMIVQIYLKDKLCGEYTITKLLPQPELTRAAYGNIVKPLDELVIPDYLTCQFECEKNGVLCDWCQAHNQGFVNRIHNGQDIKWDTINGETIRAMKDGKVVARVNTNSSTSYGSYVKIDHEDGTYTLYAHMQYNSVCVYEGQRVSKGTVIGKVGNTGLSTNPHLHLSVFNGSTAIDPMPYLEAATAYNAPSNTYKVITSAINIRTAPSYSSTLYDTVYNGASMSISKIIIDKNSTNIFGKIASGTYQGKWMSIGTTIGDVYAVNMSDIWYVFSGPVRIRNNASTNSYDYGYATNESSFYLTDVTIYGDYIMGKIASSPSPVMASGSTCTVANAKNHWIALNYCAPFIN